MIQTGGQTVDRALDPSIESKATANNMSNSYTPAEYVAELDRQIAQVSVLTAGLSVPALNWQPDPHSWSIGQCMDHLVRTNEAVLAAMRTTAEANRDELRPRAGDIQPAGWPS